MEAMVSQDLNIQGLLLLLAEHMEEEVLEVMLQLTQIKAMQEREQTEFP